MQSLHRNLGFFVAIVNAVVGVWALVSIRVRWLEQPAMWWAIAVAQLSALLQVVIGVYLLAVQGDEVDEFHVFYGVLVAIAIALAFIYAWGSEWVQERRALFYGLVSLFLMGLALRAIGLAGGFG